MMEPEEIRAETSPPLGGHLRPVERLTTMPLRRVRKGYEQVADQIRELIISGTIERGERLPNETALASEFGVSRATVREALRLLAAQDLIRTAKGAGGGSYVTLPTVDRISEFHRHPGGVMHRVLVTVPFAFGDEAYHAVCIEAILIGAAQGEQVTA